MMPLNETSDNTLNLTKSIRLENEFKNFIKNDDANETNLRTLLIIYNHFLKVFSINRWHE